MGRKTSLRSYEVSKESPNGRNLEYKHKRTGETVKVSDMVKRIKDDNIADGHIRNVNGKDTPATNPDRSKKNNLG